MTPGRKNPGHSRRPGSKSNRHLEDAKAVLAGNEKKLKELTVKHLGTADLEEADRRSRVVREWRDENGQ